MLNNDELVKLKVIVEGLLLAANEPLEAKQIADILSSAATTYSQEDVESIVSELNNDYAERGIEVKEVASGLRLQVKEELSQWVSKLWETRPQRYSKALLEILSLIAYKQPITRAEIEEVRGVALSSDIVKRLFDREWIKVVGHKDVPGRPTLFATTDKFLDYFGLKSLSELPSLPEFIDENGDVVLNPGLKQHELKLEATNENVEDEVETTSETIEAEDADEIEAVIDNEAEESKEQEEKAVNEVVDSDIEEQQVETTEQEIEEKVVDEGNDFESEEQKIEVELEEKETDE